MFYGNSGLWLMLIFGSARAKLFISFISVVYFECASWYWLLCWHCREFLDKVQLEIDCKPDLNCTSAANSVLPSMEVGDDVIKQLFQGELISKVSSCKLMFFQVQKIIV